MPEDAVVLQKSTKTVTVACKMPNGIILHVDDMVKTNEPVMGGGSREVMVARRRAETYTINGAAVPVGTPQPRHTILGGYALTHGIPAEFFEKWAEQHKELPLVKNGLIFAMPTRDAAEDRAEKESENRSGLEPLDPSVITRPDGSILPADPRVPKSLNPNLVSIHKADVVKAA